MPVLSNRFSGSPAGLLLYATPDTMLRMWRSLGGGLTNISPDQLEKALPGLPDPAALCPVLRGVQMQAACTQLAWQKLTWHTQLPLWQLSLLDSSYMTMRCHVNVRSLHGTSQSNGGK